MKKISMFMLMIFGAFILFAQEAPKEEPKNEEVKAEAQPAEAAQEAPKEAETPAQEEQKPAETQPAETPAQEEQKPAEPEAPEKAEAAPQEEQTPAETVEEAPAQAEQPAPANAPQPYVYGKTQKIKYYRPYLGAGVPLIVIGSVSFLIMMPAMGTMAFAASDACEGKDWDFCEELHENNKKHHTAWTVGSVMTGVVGAGMIAVGSWLTSIEKPKNMPVEISGFSILPSNKGMFASLGLKF